MSTTPVTTPPKQVVPLARRRAQRPEYGRNSSSVRFTESVTTLQLQSSPQGPVFRRLMTDGASSGMLSPRTPAVLNDINPFDREIHSRNQRGTIFGRPTYYKPLWLLAMGIAGNFLYGTGALALERGTFARRPVAPPGGGRALPPIFQPLFGDRKASIGVGAASILGGLVLAVSASLFFYADSRRLARRQNPASPRYLRPNLYFGIHMGAILLSVGGKFMGEVLRDVVSRDTTWVAGLPSLIGQAAFAVTQAQAFSGCEVLNGKMPLKHRTAIGFAARTCSGAWTILGVINTVPYFNPYVRELTRLFCQSAMTLAFSLPLTTARISRTEKVHPSAPQPKPSWYTLQVLGVYLVGRVLLGYAPDLLQRPQAVNETGDPTAGGQTGGAVMLSIGTAICVAMIMLFKEDVAAYNPRKAKVLATIGIVAVLLIMTYRGIFEIALESQNFSLRWASTVPGALGAGLRLAVLSEMFAFSELRNGDLPLPKRYHWTEASRATGIVGYGLWASMLSVPNFNPYVREAVGIYAALAATLGMALPTTTSKRAVAKFDWPLSPGSTPPATSEGFSLSPFSAHSQAAQLSV